MIDDEKLQQAKTILGGFSKENQLKILKRLLTETPLPPKPNDYLIVANRTQQWKNQFGKLQAFLLSNGFLSTDTWWNGNGAEFEVLNSEGDIKLTLSNGYSSEKEEVEKIELFFRLQVPDKSST